MTTLVDPAQLGDVRGLSRARWLRLPLPKVLRGKFSLVAGIVLLAAIAVLCLGAPLFTSASPLTSTR